jgi:redox-sensitive bicupin YhaK (pirin superfamily)
MRIDLTEVCTSAMSLISKKVRLVIPTPSPHWVGDGFYVKPLFNNLAFTNEISPFLMFDYAAPKQFESTSKRRGVGTHPHRGFETVTIALQGEIDHRDSQGNEGSIKEGDVQWMTAGAGLTHEEFLSGPFLKKGGVLEMVQLWVNLPAKDKMVKPRYQAIMQKEIPVVQLASGEVRVIAGLYEDISGAAFTFSPINVWEVKVHGDMEVNIPEGFNTIIFVRTGILKLFDDDTVYMKESTILLTQAGTVVKLTSVEGEANLLILSGEPINEPIAARGPFVMNTDKELRQAMTDYQNGVF